MADLRYEILTGDAVRAAIPDIAALRIAVFAEYPYLYDGDADYEERYLRPYAASAGAIVVTANAGGRIVGAATGTPMEDHADEFAAPLAAACLDPADAFYCAESVLLPEFRGRGAGHRFFDLREDHARALGRRWACFCAVVRPDGHPARPADYRPLDDFWRRRGYNRINGAEARFAWKEHGAAEQTEKAMSLWLRDLSRR
jgi:GNAT superfamily N-acetyltransferase